MLWFTAAKKAGKWSRGILEAAERFMVRWHEAGAEITGQRHGPAVDSVQGNGGGGGNRRRGTENPTRGMRRGGGTGEVEGKLR